MLSNPRIITDIAFVRHRVSLTSPGEPGISPGETGTGFETGDSGASARWAFGSTSPGKMRCAVTTFQPVSIPSSRNRTSSRRTRVGESPSDARRSVAIAFTRARS